MAANLTPQYHKAEDEYRRAATAEEELAALQVMLREMPKHKATDKLQAELKQKISRARDEAEAERKKPVSKRGGYKLVRQGAGTCIVLGGPNAGKSQLVASLTSAKPEIAPYPFTTREPQPGMMPWEDVNVQLLDTPPITADMMESYMQGLIRGASVAVLLVDLANDDGLDDCQAVLDRLCATKTRLGQESLLDEEDIGLSYTRTLVAPNKIDADGADDRLELLHELLPLPFDEFVISAAQGTGLAALKDEMYRSLGVVRVYTKSPTAKQADFEKPFTIRRGGTLLQIAEQVHKDFAENFSHARVWGAAVHPGSTLKGDYVLHDKDVVELHTT